MIGGIHLQSPTTRARALLYYDLKAALGKKRRDGKVAPLQPLTTVQKVYIGRLIEKYDDDYQAMFMDIKLNSMQHSVATLKKLCQRYHVHGKHFITS